MKKIATRCYLCLISIFFLSPLSLFADSKITSLTAQSQSKPILFLENKGQLTDQFGKPRKDIQFKIAANGINVFVEAGALHYQWTKAHTANRDDQDVDIYRLDAELEGANKNAILVTSEKHEYYEQYYLPHCTDGVQANSFKKITYKDIYPHIDWVLYEHQGRLKYDFIVHPGGDVSKIKFVYKGDTEHFIDKNGDIKVNTPFGSITEQKLFCYNAETQAEIPSSAEFTNTGRLVFNVGDYTGTLVIDPELEWSTYFGRSGTETGYTVVTDTSGGAYMGGYTTSSSNIATTGAFQTVFGGSNDAYIVRFSKTCQKLWATYYGGTGNDDFFSSAIDTNGNVYFAGTTRSTTGMASVGSHQFSFGGGISDCLLVKFSPTGSRIWATYYGGSSDESHSTDYQAWVACDKKNNIYLGGNTTSTDAGAIATAGVHQTTLAGARDGYLVKFSDAGVRQWGTYYGGANEDKIVKIVFDMVDNIYIAGETKTKTGTAIATSGSHQPTTSDALYTDAFLVKFLPTGQRVWGTYYGGGETDGPEGLAADVYGYIYLSGSTNSPTGIATSGSAQPALASTNGPQDCFLVKFDTAGVRQWGTYFGGPGIDHCGDMTMDVFGNICFTGFTASTTGIATQGAHQVTAGGNGTFDAFMAIFTLSGVKYWASYLGGANADYGYGLKYSNRGDLYLAGTTFSWDRISTSTTNTFQTAMDTSGRTYPDPYKTDAFLAKFQADTSTFILQPFTVTNICAGDSFYVTYGITNPFRSGNKFYVQLSNASGSFSNPDTIGVITSTNVGSIHCGIPINTPGGTGYRVRVVSSLPQSTSLENINGIVIKTLPVKPVAGSNTPVCSDGAPLNLTASTTTAGVSYSWVGPNSFTSNLQNPSVSTPPIAATGDYIVTATLNGCFTKDTTSAVVNITPVVPTLGSNSPVCSGSPLNLTSNTSTTGVTYSWTGPDTFSANVQNPVRYSTTTSGSGYYKVIVSRISCFSTDSILVEIKPTFTPLVSAIQVLPDDTICIGDTLNFSGSATGGGPSPTYQWQKNGADISGQTSTSLIYSNLAHNDEIRLVYFGSGPCLSAPADTSDPIVITVQSGIVPAVGIDVVPGIIAPEHTLLLFTALDTNGGQAPTFQWFKNGSIIPGAISNVLPQYTTDDLASGDQVCVRMKSSLSCAEPDSATGCTGLIDVTSIGGMAKDEGLKLFPNPNKGFFSLKGIVNFNKSLKIEILNALGQVVYTDSVLPVNNELNMRIELETTIANGVYLLRLTGEHETEMMRFTLSR